MAIDLVGRAAEIEQLDRFLDAIAATPPSPSGAVLEGPAGIGKSSVWSAATERAAARGITVLAARPSEAEATFAFQALADLLEPIRDEVAALPAPQRRNLEVAFLREDPAAGESLDPQAVASAASNVIRGAALRGPLLIAVDDAPWLDASSSRAVAFIVRRLTDRRIGVLLSQRVDAPGPAPLDLERAIPTERLWLGPLGRAELHVLLASRLGMVLPRATLARLHEQSAGNPFHALEIGRALQRLPALPRPGDPLPVPESVRGLIEGRLGALSTRARDALLLAALAGSPSVEVIRAALAVGARGGGSAGRGPLDEAADAGLIAIDGGTVRFGHPLIASTVVSAAGAVARRAAHRALAAVVSEPEARGRHLALATTEPDAAVAAALEAASDDARRRGATGAAVELYRLAADLTPAGDPEARDRRRLRLGMALFRQADLRAAVPVLDEVIGRLPPGPLLAEARLERGSISWYLETPRAAVHHLEEALRALGRSPDPDPTVPDDPELAELLGRIYLRLGQFIEDMQVSRGHRAAAAAVLERHGPRTSYATALMMLFWADVGLGGPADLSLLERGLAVEEGGHEDSSTLPGLWWMQMDRPDLARERFLWMRRAGEEIGELSGEADLLTQLAQVEVYADDWPLARRHIDEARMLAAQEGQTDPIPAIRVRALLDAHEGRLDEAKAAAEPAADQVFAEGGTIVGVALLHVLTFVAASRGDARTVVELTGRAMRELASIRWVDAMRMDPVPERVEALALLGELDEATTLLAELDRRQRVVPKPWLAASIARGRALLLAARGDADAAVAATDPATDERSAAWRSFDRARTLFVRGQILRQLRRPREAGLALDAALATFERLGARAWAARASAELGRLGRRRPGRDDLTPAERQVAALAADGLRNHEVAARLGISPKTVEAHLARIYAKLGIRSRAELGRAMAGPADRAMP